MLDFAPETAEFYGRDPEAAFAQLRATEPVHWYEPGRFWCLTRQAEIREASRNPKTFSSAYGIQMFQIAEAHAGNGPTPDDPSAASILQMDPPEHLRHRKLVMSAFRPKYMAELETRIREITVESLDACDPAGEVDFVEQIAVPLPMRVIAEMIGVPPADAAVFRRWSDSIIEAGGGGVTEQTLQDMGELFANFTESIEEHRATPRADIITLLLEAEIDGERLGKGEILMFLLTLLVAGNETTRNLIAGGGRALAEHPDQRALLAADPALIPGGVDEMLRWVTPVRSFVRRAQVDTTIGDTAIRAEDYVVMFYGSGNRDQAEFGPTADQFDVTRADAYRHIAFGFGEHLCLGAALAKVEARVMFEELLQRWPSWDIVGDIVPLESCLMNGLVHMPVRLGYSAGAASSRSTAR
ncbi:MAG: cytochrome P450 [Acidimicrobiia bacterium]|nr:cytochrome P450 [Acidimicrobiia bacterium]